MASALVVPLILVGGRRNRAQHLVEKLWAGGVLRIAGIRVEVEGLEHLPKTGAVITPNHRSNADILAIMGVAATPARFVAKAELKWVFFISLGMWATGHIFVKRGKRKSGGRALGAAARALQKGAWVLLFPEGTRVRKGGSLPWKTGAFRAAVDGGVPVVPTAIHNARAVWPTMAKMPRGGTMRVQFLPPIHASQLEKPGFLGLRNAVREQVVAQLDE